MLVTNEVLDRLDELGCPVWDLIHDDDDGTIEPPLVQGECAVGHRRPECSPTPTEQVVFWRHATQTEGVVIVERCPRCARKWKLWDDVDTVLAHHHGVRTILSDADTRLSKAEVTTARRDLAWVLLLAAGVTTAPCHLGTVRDQRLAEFVTTDLAALRAEYERLRYTATGQRLGQGTLVRLHRLDDLGALPAPHLVNVVLHGELIRAVTGPRPGALMRVSPAAAVSVAVLRDAGHAALAGAGPGPRALLPPATSSQHAHRRTLTLVVS